MTQATGKRRGHGEDSIYWDESRKRYIGAVDLGFSPAGTRIRKKVSGKTKLGTQLEHHRHRTFPQLSGVLLP